MYGRRLILRHNIFANNHGPSGYGIGLKDLDGVEASDNLESKFSVKSRGVGLELLAMDDESAVLGKVDGNTREHKPRPPGMRLH